MVSDLSNFKNATIDLAQLGEIVDHQNISTTTVIPENIQAFLKNPRSLIILEIDLSLQATDADLLEISKKFEFTLDPDPLFSPTPKSVNPADLNPASPIQSILSEALLPHAYGLNTDPNQSNGPYKFLEIFASNGLIQLDIESLLNTLVKPYTVVSRTLMLQSVFFPQSALNQKNIFQENYHWQEPDNLSLKINLKLTLNPVHKAH